MVTPLLRNGKALTQILIPLYTLNEKMAGSNRLEVLKALYGESEKGLIFQNIPDPDFFLDTFLLFSLFYQKRDYLDSSGALSEKALNLLKQAREEKKKPLEEKFRLSEQDFKNIDKVIAGFYYFTHQYWFKRFREGEEILKAMDALKALRKNRMIEKHLEKISEALNSYGIDAQESSHAALVLSLIPLKKIYEQSLLPYEILIPENARHFSRKFEEIFALAQNIENLQEQPEKQKAFLDETARKLEEISAETAKQLFQFEKLLKNYSRVSLEEENRVFRKSFLLQALQGVYRIRRWEAITGGASDSSEIIEALGAEETLWMEKIQGNRALYQPIALDEQQDQTLSLKHRHTLYSFYFAFLLHQIQDSFLLPDGQIRPEFLTYFQRNIPEPLKNFQENDLKVLTDRISVLHQILLALAQKNEGFLKKQKHFRQNQASFSLDPAFVFSLFQKTVQRYETGILLIRFSEEKAEQAVKSKTHYLIDLTVNLFLRFLLLALLFSQVFLKKFHLLFQGVERVGQGELSHRIQIAGTDEFGQLSDHFNGMTANLYRAQNQLREKTRMEEELKIAKQIQESLIPQTYPEIPGLAFASYYEAQTETGGDYLDFIVLDDKNLALVIADVSGHGVGACMVMSMIRTLIRSYAPYIRDPKEILCRINETLYQDTPSNIYATLFYALYQTETRRLVFASGGHNPAILYHPGKKEPRSLKAGGMAAGLMAGTYFKPLIQNYAITLEPGEILIQYTDGITEAMNPQKEEYGMDRLLDAVKRSGKKEIEDVFRFLIRDVEIFTKNAVQSDDMTFMGFQIKD